MQKNVVISLLSNHRAAKYIFKRVVQVDLEGDWVYVDGSGFVSMTGSILHSLFTCSSSDVSEMIFLCILTLLNNGVKKHCVCVCTCVLWVEVSAAYTCVPINQNTGGESKYSHISLDSVFFKMFHFVSIILIPFFP